MAMAAQLRLWLRFRKTGQPDGRPGPQDGGSMQEHSYEHNTDQKVDLS